jgi:hypothetical protein
MIALIDEFNQVSLHDPTQDIIDIYSDVPEINEIDNRGFPICRPLFSHSSLPDELGFELVRSTKFDFKSEFSYFVHVHHNQKLWTRNINLIPKVILNQVRKGNCTLIFDNTLEGNRVDGEWFIDPLYESIDKLKLPTHKIVFVTNDLNSEFEHKKFHLSGIKVISFMWNVYDVKRLTKKDHLRKIKNIDTEINYKKNNLKKIKSFLKVNRTNRPERNIFMLFMNYHKLFDKSLISFPTLPEEDYPPGGFEKYLTKENIEDLKSKVPFDIDKTDETNHGDAGFGKGFFDADLPFQPIHYKNSFISIVFCAFPFEDNACHLHSSTFNPIYQGQPIIQFGPYKSLERMRERGFKTFDKWWDEDYDNIEDGWERFEAILKLVKQISKKTNEELFDIYVDMKTTLQHNIDLINKYDIHKNLTQRIFNE